MCHTKMLLIKISNGINIEKIVQFVIFVKIVYNIDIKKNLIKVKILIEEIKIITCFIKDLVFNQK